MKAEAALPKVETTPPKSDLESTRPEPAPAKPEPATPKPEPISKKAAAAVAKAEAAAKADAATKVDALAKKNAADARAEADAATAVEGDLPVKDSPVNANRPAPSDRARPTAALGTNPNDLPSQVAGIFFGLLEKSQIEAAYEGLTKGSKIADRPEELKTLKTKTREAIEVFGPVISFEAVETKRVGAHLLRRTYLSLNREFPLRWRFYFYLSGDLWRLIDLRVDDRVTGMFEEVDDAKSASDPK